MQGVHLRKYGVETTVDFELFEVDGIDFRVDAVHASGDIKVMKDEGAEATSTNGFTDEGQGYSVVLTATEMQAARVVLYIVDQTATKVWLDKSIVIETYGNASAMHAFDLDTASTAQTGDSYARIGAAGASLTDLGGMSTTMKAQVNTEADTALADYDPPTNAEMEARTLAAAAYFDPAADAVANVTLVGTTTTNTDMRGTDGANTVVPDAAGVAPTADEIADAVLDEALADHVTAGTLSKAVADIEVDTATTLPAAIGNTATSAALSTAQADLDTITGADGVNLLSATQASIDAIEADTNELQTDDIPGKIVTLDAVVDTVKAETALIVADTNELQTDWADGGRLDLLLDAVPTTTEIWDVAMTELAAIPGASPKAKEAIALLFMALRNKLDVTATTKEVHNDAGTLIATKTLSDNGTTYSEGKMA